MPRRSIILQELEENEKKLTSYNQAVGGYNAETDRRNANYNNAVNAYNTHAAPLEGYESNYVNFMSSGAGLFNEGKVYYTRGWDGGWDGAYWSVPGRELSWDEAVAIGESQKDPVSGWNMSNLPGKRPDASSFVTYDQNDPNWAEIRDPNNPQFQSDLAAAQAQWDKTKGIHEAGGVMYYDTAANVRINSKGKTDTTNLAPGTAYNAAYRAPTKPTAPPTPEEPGFYTLSRREEQELVNPTLTGAEAALAANKGGPAKTNLADQASSGASVYAERDKEKTIEQSGILARVLSGQLA